MFEWKNLCLKKNCPPFPVNFWEKVDSTGKFLSEAFLFAEHVLPWFELGIFMY
jgi:hypothetical protein